MAQKPLSEMADRGYANGSEETGYILHELKAFASQVSAKLEKAVTSSELQAVWRSCEHLFALKADTVGLLTQLSNKVESVDEIKANILLIVSQFEQYAKQTDVSQLATYVSNQIDTIKTNTVDVTISSAELLALSATPKTLLAAPGAGKYLEVVRVELFYDFNAAAYAATAGKDVSLEYATSGQLISVAASGVLDQVTDQRRCLTHSESHLVGVNEAVILKMVGGEVTTGDSPLKVRLDYRIVDVLV